MEYGKMTGALKTHFWESLLMKIRRLLVPLLFLALFGGFWAFGTPLSAGPLDKVVEFYTSPFPNPPKVPIDVGTVVNLAETGDIVIENNRAFPQWAVMIGMLVPNTRYVHGGMVVKGHVLKRINTLFGKKIGARKGFTVYRKQKEQETRDGKPVTVWRWKAQPEIHYGRAYVITPEVVEKETDSRVVALDLGDYLVDPGFGYPTKHIKLLRPKICEQRALDKVANYLGYHLLKRTPYDMGFDIKENEIAIKRSSTGETEYDISIMPVPLYCTELILRALREGGLDVEPTFINQKAAAVARFIPGLPKMVSEKLRAPFITADCFLPRVQVLYQNEAPPSVGEILKTMGPGKSKTTCDHLARKLAGQAANTQRLASPAR
jgi:hypothetical protein